MHIKFNKLLLISFVFIFNSQQAAADECPVELVSGMELNQEFGSGTSDKTNCLSKREEIKIVMQLNKSCRDSYATHPVGENGKPSGEASKIVNNVANCSRPYALGNLNNMLKDYIITNGVENDDIDIKVIVHSGGGYLLLKDEGYDGSGSGSLLTGRNKFQPVVEALMDKGSGFTFARIQRGVLSKKVYCLVMMITSKVVQMHSLLTELNMSQRV